MAPSASPPNRFRVNLVSFFATVTLLSIAVRLSDGGFATSIDSINRNLDRALSNLMDGHRTNYTELSDNGTYVSDTAFYPRGMAGLYNFTEAFMDAVMSKEVYPEGLITVENNSLKLGDFKNEWRSLLSKYGGLLALLIVLLIFMLLMPLCGFFFCCCRCCGKCGARSQPIDKKHDLCKKIVLSTLLICLGTLLLFGVVCAFVSNEQMHEGVNGLTKNLRDIKKDVDTYMDATKKQIGTLFDVNYQEFQGDLTDILNKSYKIVLDQLMNMSDAISMTRLSAMATTLTEVEGDFVTLKYSTIRLRTYASQLSDAVRQVKKELLDVLSSKECTEIPTCSKINSDVGKLNTNIHFNSLPDLSNSIKDLEKYMKNDELNNAMHSGDAKLHEIQDEIGSAVNKTVILAREKISEAGIEIKKGSDEIIDAIVQLQGEIDDNTDPALKKGDEYIQKYAPYGYYVALAISCLLLLISLFVALGLICGVCGKRPDVYGDDCCNKGAGSKFLICGVMLMFLTAIIISLVVAISLTAGIVTQRIFCDSLRDPDNSQVFDLINQLNISGYTDTFKISEALSDCYQNKSIYNVLHLEKRFDLSIVQNYTKQINDTLNKLNIDSINFTNFQILTGPQIILIKNLQTSDFANINLDEFEHLNESFTTVNLTELADSLVRVIETLPDSSEIKARLEVNQLTIKTYDERIMQPMIKNATGAFALAQEVESKLKQGEKDFSTAIGKILDEIKDAENYLKANGTKVLAEIATNFKTQIFDQVSFYMEMVVNQTRDGVGQCGPLSRVVNATLTSTCDKILMPWNGYWFSLFWSLLLFVPAIVVSVKLATLYQKYSPYSGPLVEARNKARGKKGKKQQRYEERGVPVAEPPVQDTRYADMAPKQFEDFPSGGPPQYQRAPTEYERPPPYYYPGTGEAIQ